MNYEVPNSTRAKECERIQRFRCPVGQTSRSPPGIMNYVNANRAIKQLMIRAVLFRDKNQFGACRWNKKMVTVPNHLQQVGGDTARLLRMIVSTQLSWLRIYAVLFRNRSSNCSSSALLEMGASTQKEYDIILFGATGYTGKLCAEHITLTLPTDLKWAVAGRSASKLSAVADELKSFNRDRRQPGISKYPISLTSASLLKI